jgi:Zn-dependent M28 family amino/carboxypeptidase
MTGNRHFSSLAASSRAAYNPELVRLESSAMRRFAFLPLAALIAACQPSAPSPNAESGPPTAKPAPIAATFYGVFSPEIKAEDFAAHVKRVASDEFAGRKPGTDGERLTTSYLVEQFKRMGLKPGNGDSFLQSVPMDSTTLRNPDAVTLAIAEGGGVEKFAYRSDTIVATFKVQPQTVIHDADLVFAGYGVIAPEYQWNDYAGLDVKGKIVVVLVNDPGWGNGDPSLFKGKAMTYYGRWTYKYEEAARQGAAGCLIVHDTAAAAYPWKVVVNSWSGPRLSLPASENAEPRLELAGWLTTEAARRLFAKAGADFDALKKGADLRGFKSTPLAAKLSTQFDSEIGSASSNNVLALLPGSQRPDEVVVYSAHWDHLGADGSGAEHIYSGAIDNATGVAAVLEIADAFAHQSPPPQRSVLFFVPTLEEAYLLGSQYYTAHPTIAADKTVADINIDMLPIIGRTRDMEIVGYGQSQMDGYLRDALATQHRVVVAEAAPEKGLFYRSDQLNFARKGVPVLFAHGGEDKLDGGTAAGHTLAEDYYAHRYHQPADKYDANWDFSGVVEDVQALYAVGKRLADETTWPQWAADSEFRAARAAAKPAETH